MKKLIALGALLISFSTFATSVSFTYFGNENGGQSYYACYYVEARATRFLELLGAKNINVKCFGGIRSWSVQPISVEAQFDLPQLTGQSVEQVELQGELTNPGCGINVMIIKSLIKEFSNVEIVKKNDSCAFVNSNYYYLINISR